jgi:superfamily II DNA or RNA helicase
VETARELLDFAAGASGVVTPAVAAEQLDGAVAVHNMLATQNVAYLADEVGMGKTYVALGAMALFRHFEPSFRVMVIAPRQNIQDKWMKEWRNFVGKVVRVDDLRVRSLAGTPVRSLVKTHSLADLVTETSNDPDRDFFARMTSFSLPSIADDENGKKRRAQLLRAVPWLDPDALNAKSKERYRRNFARAVNCALPDIDLLIVDEAHNLKAGWRERGSSTRNTVLACALGGRSLGDDDSSLFRGYRQRAKRVLFLSATPIEYDISQLWNQLDLFGFGAKWKLLNERSLSPDEHREIVRQILIRRTTQLPVAGKRLTKTEYRREWRRGGIGIHDEPLALANDRQRLAVALVQKKVAEVLGNGKFNHAFQVGLLASFESFLETVKSSVTKPMPATEEHADGDEAGSFHRSADEVAATRLDRRDGADILAVNSIAESHRRRFKAELPHPKMDAMVDQLAESLANGQKALVFVRRVASVDELQWKLEEKYDARLFTKLRTALGDGELRNDLDRQIDKYVLDRSETRRSMRARQVSATDGAAHETSSAETFFSWFFRGEGPEGVRSGASLALDLDKASGNYATLLEDNHVAVVLGVQPSEIVSAIALRTGSSEETVLAEIAMDAARYDGAGGAKLQRRSRLRAFQAAALDRLSKVQGEIGEEAKLVRRDVFGAMRARTYTPLSANEVRDWLTTPTLFTELRSRPALSAALLPAKTGGSISERVRDREIRRELFSTMVRKGHPIIDLFVVIARRLGTLKQRARESEIEPRSLSVDFLDMLETQAVAEAGRFTSYYELAQAARCFDLIVQLNAPELRSAELSEIPTRLGRVLRAQRPVAGMAGTVNTEVVKQFRMPGYPLLLITTDLLKEGEDLHTFCSKVYHYGVAWMPSELEQRVGRVDRVGSHSERRFTDLTCEPTGDELLQVYYPHLRDTVETLQLNRVYSRLNRFLRMMHEGLGVPPIERPNIDISVEGLRTAPDTAPITTRLESAFKVAPRVLEGSRRPLADSVAVARGLQSRMAALEDLFRKNGANEVHRTDDNQIVGEAAIAERVQPFTVLLRSIRGHAMLRCVSPIGRIDTQDWDDVRAAKIVLRPFTRIALVLDERFDRYELTVEGDVLLADGAAGLRRVWSLVECVTHDADRAEKILLGTDVGLADVSADIGEEPNVAR